MDTPTTQSGSAPAGDERDEARPPVVPEPLGGPITPSDGSEARTARSGGDLHYALVDADARPICGDRTPLASSTMTRSEVTCGMCAIIVAIRDATVTGSTPWGFTITEQHPGLPDHGVPLGWVGLLDREGNTVAGISGDGLLIEVYDTDGELHCRLNRSLTFAVRERLNLRGPANHISLETSEPEPGVATIHMKPQTPAVVLGFEHRQVIVSDENDLSGVIYTVDGKDLAASPIERATMVARLRAIARALETS